MYTYDQFDRTLVAERVAELRDQVDRRLSGALSEEEFRPLRLMNGLYLQLHAYMLRIAIPYGTLSSAQLRLLAAVGRRYDRGYGHFTTRQNIQFNWIKLESIPDLMADLASVGLHGMQTSGNCVRNITTDQWAGVAPDGSRIRASGPNCCANIPRCIRNSRFCRANSRSPLRQRAMTALPSRCTTSGCACTVTPRALPVSKCWSAAASGARRSSPRPCGSSCPERDIVELCRGRFCASTTSSRGGTISINRGSRFSFTISVRKPSPARSRPSGNKSMTKPQRSTRRWSPRSRRVFTIRRMSASTISRRNWPCGERRTGGSTPGWAMPWPITKCPAMPS